MNTYIHVTFRGGSVVKNLLAMEQTACNTGDLVSSPGLERLPGEENGNPL